MCSFKSETQRAKELAAYYSASFATITENDYIPRYYENAFDHLDLPIITAGRPNELILFKWGLIPYWTKSLSEAVKVRTLTVNCKSEEMYEKASFKDAAINHQRCLIPCTGFYEWKHLNRGRTKIPHFIKLTHDKLFSLAGLYSRWRNPESDRYIYTYSVLTTRANKLMDEIHNTKRRMPVIISREHERDWLNKSLSKDDVMDLCRPISESVMTAYSVGKLISMKDADKNVPEVMNPYVYPEEMKLF
jgi:putative SOS response-associated peptidase YedK